MSHLRLSSFNYWTVCLVLLYRALLRILELMFKLFNELIVGALNVFLTDL